jgi:hypothetical protein
MSKRAMGNQSLTGEFQNGLSDLLIAGLVSATTIITSG